MRTNVAAKAATHKYYARMILRHAFLARLKTFNYEWDTLNVLDLLRQEYTFAVEQTGTHDHGWQTSENEFPAQDTMASSPGGSARA
jgi:hypothetical protein